jgi:hypothetical protein
MIVSLVPQGVSITAVFEKIIVPPLQQLEQGIKFYFGPSGKMEIFAGTPQSFCLATLLP